jgi:hypothetical protein
MGRIDSGETQFTADGRIHLRRLIRWEPYREVRKTEKNWRLDRCQPAGRKPTRAFPRGRPRGPQGQSERKPAPAWHAPLHSVAVRGADGPGPSPGRTKGRRSPGVDTAWKGEHVRPQLGQTSIPQTGVPGDGERRHRMWHHRDAQRGIPRLNPWKEVKAPTDGTCNTGRLPSVDWHPLLTVRSAH